jgi:hypothetical protein
MWGKAVRYIGKVVQPVIVAEAIRLVSFKAGTAHRGVWEKWGNLEPRINAMNGLPVSAACMIIEKKKEKKAFGYMWELRPRSYMILRRSKEEMANKKLELEHAK